MKLYTYMYCRLKRRKKGEQLYSIESDCLYTIAGAVGWSEVVLAV